MPHDLTEEIIPNLFRATVPLPHNPLKATNSYLIKAKPRNLVIDTGLNREECKKALLQAFAVTDLNLEQTDFFITHLHADHIGLVESLASVNAKIYFNRPDAEVLQRQDLWSMATRLTGKHGFPAELVDLAIDSHPAQRYVPDPEFKYTLLDDGDLLEYGDFRLKCLITPGHTRGHTCLYEPERKLLFSGDHILGDITPNITTLFDGDNPLADYFNSLEKIYEMDVDLVLPGHRNLVHDCRARIEEILVHHRERLDEVIEILKNSGSCSAYDMASRMTWDLVADGWDDFPLMQKWFATGEALAHIRLLEATGEVKSSEADGVVIFNL